MGRWNIRWSILLVLWCVTGVKLAAMKVESLDRGWVFNRGDESQAADKVTVDLPHTWNAADAMFGNVNYYRGMSTYSRFIVVPSSENYEDGNNTKALKISYFDGREVRTLTDAFVVKVPFVYFWENNKVYGQGRADSSDSERGKAETGYQGE